MEKIATFHTQSAAIRFHKNLNKLGLTGVLKPVPRKLSSSCGICVAFEFEDYHKLLMDDLENIYSVHGTEYLLLYEHYL